MDVVIAQRLARRGGVHQQRQQALPNVYRSVLASRLIELWSWGQISSPLLQWLADGALTDLRAAGSAAEHITPDLAKLAEIGATGEWAQNTRRDLLGQVLPTIHVAEPLRIRVPFVRPHGPHTEVSFTDAAAMMPNELFESLHHHYNRFVHAFVLPTT